MSFDTERVRQLASARLGLDLSRHSDAWLETQVHDCAQASGAETTFLGRLQQTNTDSPEWMVLIDRVTIPETYFFRDAGQMQLLETELLPRLLLEAKGRSLHLWSAGCSTGEEVYSLAILLDRLGVRSADLLGTDLRAGVIDKARQGLYRARTLRSLDPETISRYFEPQGTLFRVADRLRQGVRFLVENLMGPARPTRRCDLIICRNVLIYFTRDALPKVLQLFYDSLRPGGILLTGHGELLSVETPFLTLSYPGSLVYQRPDSSSSTTGSTTESSRPIPPAPPPWPPSLRGSHPASSAEELCRQARHARTQGRWQRAHDLLRQAIYLDPEEALAYLELALWWSAEDRSRAQRYRISALQAFQQRPASGAKASEFARTLAELDTQLEGPWS